MDSKTKEYYRLPRIRNKRWTILMGIVLLTISLVCFSYNLINLIITTAAEDALGIIAMITISGYNIACAALVPIIILGMLIYEIKSLVDLIRRIKAADEE